MHDGIRLLGNRSSSVPHCLRQIIIILIKYFRSNHAPNNHNNIVEQECGPAEWKCVDKAASGGRRELNDLSRARILLVMFLQFLLLFLSCGNNSKSVRRIFNSLTAVGDIVPVCLLCVLCPSPFVNYTTATNK